jgi:polyhydroxyalkanoate synthesis repressor PhaR
MPSRRQASDAATEAVGGVRILKKYPNRRLYDTRNSSYITLADVKQMVLAGEDFEVRDAKTAEDLTRAILLQIILQFLNQSKGLYDPKHLSPEVWTQFLSGQAPTLQSLMTGYVEQSREMFEKLQRAGTLFPGMPGFPPAKK